MVKAKRYIILAVVLIVVLVVGFGVQGYHERIILYNQVVEAQNELALSRAYDATVRQALFQMVVDEQKYQYAEALSVELQRSVESMVRIGMLQASRMGEAWADYFNSDLDNIGNLYTDFYIKVLQTNFLLNLAQEQTPTQAELDVLNGMRQVWEKADALIELKQLNEKSFSLAHGSDGIHYAEVVFHIEPEADLIAEHLVTMQRDYTKLPCLIDHFIYDRDELDHFVITDPQLEQNQEVSDEAIVGEVIDTLRHYVYEKVVDEPTVSAYPDYTISYYQEKKWRYIDVYKGYVKVYGDVENLYRITMQNSERVTGFYKTDAKLLTDIGELAAKYQILTQ